MMEKRRVGIITMGDGADRASKQDLFDRFAPEIQVELVGVLDGLFPQQIKDELWPKAGEAFIVTDDGRGNNVRIAERHAKRIVAQRAAELRARGVDSILVLCTGAFDRPDCGGLLYIPEDILFGLLRGLGQPSIGFIVPEPEQIPDSQRQYQQLNPIVKAASPYGSMEHLRRVAESFRQELAEVIVTDCMGFTSEMGRLVAEASGKQVLVPRVVIPNLIKSILLQN